MKKLVAAGHASDSEGVVTSKVEAKKLAAAAKAAKAAAKAPRAVPVAAAPLAEETPEDEELENLLAETLEEENGLQNDEHEEEHEEEEEEEEEEDAGGDDDARGEADHLENIELDLSNDPGTGSIKERATRTALKTIGYESWKAFTTELSKSSAAAIAAAAASGTATTRRKPRAKPAEAIKIDQVINSTSPVYHAGFKKAYYAAKSALEKKEVAKRKAQELEEHSSLVPRWSSVSAADHTWFLRHEGHQLIGADAERYATLAAKFEAEKLEYWAAVEAEARSHSTRYQHIGARQGGQLQEDLNLRRKKVIETLPQYWKLRNVVDLAAVGDKSGGGRQIKSNSGVLFPFKKELLRQGEAPTLLQLPPGSNLPGNKLYLPAQISDQAGPRPGEAGAVYRKACIADLWDDTNVTVALQKTAELTQNEDLGIENSKVVVCATAGAMLCMLRSSLLNHSTAWHIPVVVKLGDSGDVDVTSDQKTMIYLGKPVLTEKETLRSKQQRLQKYAIITEGLAVDQTHRPKPRNADPGPREASYWLTTTSTAEGEKIPLCIRTHGRVVLQPKPEENHPEEEEGEEEEEPVVEAPLPPPPPVSAVLAVSTEYLPQPDIEQDTPNELATWWAKLALSPGADTAAVAHVHVPSSRLINWTLWTSKDIALEFATNTLDVEASAKRFIDTIMSNLVHLEPGKYVLRHSAGKKTVDILEEAFLKEGDDDEDLLDDVYDLHASQAIAGETDTSIDPFVPPKWRPYREDVAQVPFTFPPEVHGRGRGGGGGGGKGGGGRKRRRNNVWQGDLDQVQHVATICRSEYTAQLNGDL